MSELVKVAPHNVLLGVSLIIATTFTISAWDILFFGVVLGTATVVGMVLIVVAGILVLRRSTSA